MKYFKRREPEIEKDEIQSSLGFRKSTIIAGISCGIATIITIVVIIVTFLV